MDRFASTMAVADLNGDGWPDLLAAGSDVAVYLGGPGGFTALPSVSASANLPSALADFNGDGILDLVAMSGNDLELFFGNGDGTFGPGQLITGGSAPCLVETSTRTVTSIWYARSPAWWATSSSWGQTRARS